MVMDSGLIQKAKAWGHEFGFFTLGMVLGTCYGAVVATLITYGLLMFGRGAT